MILSVCTNWDHELIERLEGTPIGDFYGKAAADPVGGGRAAFTQPHVTRRHMEAHIRLVRARGYGFTYLLNAACMGNRELTRRGHRELLAQAEWAAAAGATAVTVALPFVAEALRRRFPQLAIHVSTFAEIDCLTRARFWDEAGAAVLTLSAVRVNRDFAFLRRLVPAVRASPQLILNNACLRDCPMSLSHPAALSHASQTGHRSRGMLVDYSRLRCIQRKIERPEDLISADWIRPEDVARYEALGITRFKVVDRTFGTPHLERIVRAYAARRHDGDLMELLSHFPSGHADGDLAAKTRFLRYFLRPAEINPLRLGALSLIAEPLPLRIDNRRLDGFLDHFERHDCRAVECEACPYCRQVARQVVTVDEPRRRELLRRHAELRGALESGRFFGYRG
ncbi:MAG: U32 family peptidase [Pseudomonadota bacterium]